MTAAVVVLTALGLALAACGSEDGSATDPDEEEPTAEIDGSWLLIGATVDGAELGLAADAPVTLTVAGGTAEGVSACNRYSADLERDGTAVRFEQLGSTEMGCEPDVMALETTYVAALGLVERADVSPGALVLAGPDVELTFEELPEPVSAEVLGTSWVLESLVDGDSVSSVLGDPAVLLLVEGGAATVGTGCQVLQGSWDRPGAQVEVSTSTGTGVCPPELEAQDLHVQTVYSGPVTFEVDGDLLTVVGADGRGLTYRAERPAS